MGQINWQRTRDILICIICVGFIFSASWALLGQFVEAIVILVLSMAIAFLLTPLVNLLTRAKIPRVLSTAIVYIGVLFLLGFLIYQLGANVAEQGRKFSGTVYDFVVSIPDRYNSTINWLKEMGIAQSDIDNVLNELRTQAWNFASSAPLSTVNILTLAVQYFLNIFLVVVMSFYLTLDGKRIRDSLVGLAPKRFLPNVLLFEDALTRVVGNYIRGQLTLALIVGAMTGLVCVFNPPLGEFALICAVLAFLFETIPMVGPALASITPIVISLLEPQQFPRTFIVAGCFVAIQLIESNILGPRIVGHAVGLHPVAAILALLVGARLFGVFGALLATPIVAALWVVVSSIYRSARGETPDQILARKRAPWTIRRPNGRFRVRLRPPNSTDESEAQEGEVEYSDLIYAIDQEGKAEEEGEEKEKEQSETSKKEPPLSEK
ncbi:putative PurR-regulated permease PerM [Thermosporothrix hazakensis]|jgi:predicted PurR-regulated permease PerM|uniref:AI-2E family transporter n=2 Tax=Thermosporothrix TaxID=768650 RepID=A0A455SPQ1_9CHLR|nr:AI-2E family transporter [Thermosporothrix hazakensis]PZW36673.1 putative PurR-regulated permease PerM [Thermosporothrix hazakensis]BBH89141.1 AI-2E family transporter [Thermosporothrix sp. COM3]GCE47324.1 AI-2E family transporter [Thermosporothrix hazakensis]